MFRLDGKVAVVTGAASGLGADAARAYAQQGADVAILARRKERLDTLADEIRDRYGKKVLAVACDVRSEESVKKAVEEVLAAFGKVDILLNNAGRSIRSSVENTPLEEWNDVMETNVNGIYLMCKYIIPHMKEKNYGKIINISSVNAIIGAKDPGQARHAYNASKAAVKGLTMALATSYAQNNITVNAIAPALFRTEMTEITSFSHPEVMQWYCNTNPMGRPANPGELNGAVIFFSSDASSYVTGQFLLVDGGVSQV